MLFVHHDHAKIGDRREDRGSRADGDPPLAPPDEAPGVRALAVREAAVQHRDVVAERAPEPAHRLRREADLRHQDDRPAPAGKHSTHRLEVHERLPAPGDAEEQRAGPRVEGADGAEGGLLIGRQRRRRRRPRCVREGIPHPLDQLDAGEIAFHQRPDERGIEAELFQHVPHGSPTAQGFDRLVERPLARLPLENPLAFEERG